MLFFKTIVLNNNTLIFLNTGSKKLQNATPTSGPVSKKPMAELKSPYSKTVYLMCKLNGRAVLSKFKKFSISYFQNFLVEKFEFFII